MATSESIVIVGGGLAGALAAGRLREEGYEGPVTLFGAESEHPYQRPPLSKDYLRGESGREDARVHPEGFYDDNAIELRLGERIEEIDPAAHEITVAGAGRLGYGMLLLATGSRSRRLNVPGADLDRVLYLRDLADADALAATLRAASRVAVVGSGWIGSEVAASARQLGCEVVLLGLDEVPLGSVLGSEVGAIYAQLHRDNGVELRLGTAPERFEGDGAVERVVLSDGTTIDCDAVVVGIGAIPRTELAEAAGLRVDNGVLTDERLSTSAAGIFAAGDVARSLRPFYGEELRVEHWANARRQAEIAARTMLGKPAGTEALPYFFSDQFDLGMEYTGLGGPEDEVVFRGDPAGREFIAFWLRQGRVVAAMNANVWDVAAPLEALIRSGKPIPAEALRDVSRPLEELP